MKNSCILSFLLAIWISLLHSYAQEQDCMRVDLNQMPIAQVDTLFEITVQQEKFDCGLRIYQYISTLRNEPRDHQRAAVCHYNLAQYDNAIELLTQLVDQEEPIEWVNYYLGESVIQHSRDTLKAIEYFFEEIRQFNTSSFSYDHLREILLVRQDYPLLIELEGLSEYNNSGENERIGNYLLNAGNIEQATTYFVSGCAEGFPNSCYYAYFYTDSMNIQDRIQFLSKAISLSSELNQQLFEYYEPTASSDVNSDSLFIVQDFKTNMALYHSLLSSEYDKANNLNLATEHMDIAIRIARNTPFYDDILAQALNFFHKHGMTEKILFYDNKAIRSSNALSRSIRTERLVDTTPDVRQDVLFLDSISYYFSENTESDLIIRMLQAYDRLNYNADFDRLVTFVDQKRPEIPELPAYNLVALRHYDNSQDYLIFLTRLMDPDIYLNQDLLTKEDVFDLFVAEYRYHLTVEEELEKALKSIDDLRNVVSLREEQIEDEQQGILRYYEGRAFGTLCSSASDCNEMKRLFDEAVNLNPGLVETVGRLDPCGCL